MEVKLERKQRGGSAGSHNPKLNNVQIKIDNLLNREVELREVFLIQNNRWHPYDSRSSILLILNQAPIGLYEDHLDAIMMKLQAEYCFPFNYFYIDGDSTEDIRGDLDFLISYGFIEKENELFSLTGKGKTLVETIKAKIKVNPFERLTSYPTEKTVYNVVLNFLPVGKQEIRSIKTQNYINYQKSGKLY